MPSTSLRAALVRRRWVHAHEEDTETETVYRPADFPLPPSRGRDGFELHEDGRCVALGPGRGDRPEEVSGRWNLDEKNCLRLELDSPSREKASFQIASVGENRLVIDKRRGD